MKFKEYVAKINKILEDNPEWADLPVVQIEKWETTNAEFFDFPVRSDGTYRSEDVIEV